MFRRKKNSANRIPLIFAGLVVAAVFVAFVFAKITTTLDRPRELPLGEIGAPEDLRNSLVYFAQNVEDEISPDAQNWRDAEKVLLGYFEKINAGNYTAAVALRTPEYLVGAPEIYAAALANSMKNDISGKLKITNIEQISESSKSTTKYFRFRKDAVWTFDGATHSEIKKAAVVLRDGKWTIDFFEVERKF